MTITVLVMFDVPASSRDAFIEHWEATAPPTATAGGLIEGTMLEAQSGDAPFRFVNVATWESEAAMMHGREHGTAEEEKAGGSDPRDRMDELGVKITTVVTRLYQEYGPSKASFEG